MIHCLNCQRVLERAVLNTIKNYVLTHPAAISVNPVLGYLREGAERRCHYCGGENWGESSPAALMGKTDAPLRAQHTAGPQEGASPNLAPPASRGEK